MWTGGSHLAVPAEPGLEEAGTEQETVEDDLASGPAAVTAETAECPAETDREPYEDEIKKCEKRKRKDPVILQSQASETAGSGKSQSVFYFSLLNIWTLVSFYILLMTDYIWLYIQNVFA